MKYKFLSGFLALAMPLMAHAAADFFINDGLIICPPQIPPQVDATNFVNNNFFSINFTNFTVNSQSYKTANTLNFTNRSMMIGNTGFQFDTGTTGAGQRRMAANFNNSGTISSGSAINNTNFFANFFFFGAGIGGQFLPKLTISATNVTLNSSTNIVGVNGLFRLSGKNVDLTRGNIFMEGFEESTNAFFNFLTRIPGLSDGYWGVGQNIMNPAPTLLATPFQTPFHLVNVRGGFPTFLQLQLPLAKTYVAGWQVGTNAFVQAVFLSNTNGAFSNNVYFPSVPFIGEIDIEWINVRTNLTTGALTTNYLYLFDNFGTGITNTTQTNFVGQPTAIPINYSWFRGGPLALGALPELPGSPAGLINFNLITNAYAAYRGVFSPVTVLPADLSPSAQLTNVPGRIEIGAEGILNLTRTRINGLNYLGLRATNHFAGSSRAEISVPFSDISLRSTNGNLAITNLIAPTVPRFTGYVDLWSGRWENDANGLHWNYHILFVDSHLNPDALAQVQDITLRSTNTAGGDDNVLISDVLNVTRNFTLESQRLTITTNQAPSPTASGEINLLSSQIVWPTSTPRLLYLTNEGAIRTLNAVFFGGSRTSPFYTSNFNEPYDTFVNRGIVSTEGSLIWASNFVNGGLFTSGQGFGSMTLESQHALLTNGSFLTAQGDISITSGDLVVSNHLLQTGRKLTFRVADLLTDGVAGGTPAAFLTNANAWTVGSGVDLLVKPRRGDLLGTTIVDRAPGDAEIGHLWAAEDRDCSPAGFADNAALGRLILDGGDLSSFRFTPTSLVLTFDDAANQSVPPVGTPVRSGVYKPTNYVPVRSMRPDGASAGDLPLLSPPFGTSLAVFRGTGNPGGVWRLFIDDRTVNNLISQMNWGWNLTFSVLASNYYVTTIETSLNGFLISTTSPVATDYSSANLTYTGGNTVVPAGAIGPAQPYPATNFVPLVLRNNQATTNIFTITNQIGVDIFVTNTTVRAYRTDHITNVVVALSTPTATYPADLDVLLVGPQGEKVMLMAGAGLLDTASRHAIYVDYLEFRNFTTNIDLNGNLTGVQIDPGMKVYYAQATMNGVSVAERLDGRNGGRFCWVSDYAGTYSSTNLVYSDGTTNTFNAALVQSCNIDSDGDGLVNCVDPEPLPANLAPANLALELAVVNQPPPGALVSWRGFPNSSNVLFFKTLSQGNWQYLTNIVLGGDAPPRVTVFDPMAANGTRFYRVQVSAH